jgi:creatinine amidohydrolase/Fe(II)-dependent formamide hydrolase-like protein
MIPSTFTALLVATWLGQLPDPVRPDPKAPRPIAAVDSVFLEDLTWMEIRDAMKAGKDTVIVATGGIEQNGPYLVLNKHNVVLRGTTEAIAKKLGNTLIAPIVPFVPEGDIDPPSLHMLYPGTISLRESTYQALLADICASLKTHGFKRVILIGDSGGNQAGMKEVAAELSEKWKGGTCRIAYIPEYYQLNHITKWLEGQGIKQTPEGLHDDFAMSATMLAMNPESVRMKERIAAGNFRINGIELAPAEKTIAIGKKIIELRAEHTVKAIHAAFAH